MAKVLIGSVIRKSPDILERFLTSCGRMATRYGDDVEFAFIDHNSDRNASDMLECWPVILRGDPSNGTTDDHLWTKGKEWQVAAMRNILIDEAIRRGCEHLLMIDSDVLLHPETLGHLLACDKQIISPVYWTDWNDSGTHLPQVWESDHYTLSQEFILRLLTPGTYRVGMLGGVTLFHRSTFYARHLRYTKIPNLTMWGEDRHFCIRAAVLGYEMWASTVYPTFHIYRTTDLPAADRFLAETEAQ